MPIQVTCACGKQYTLKNEFAGRRAKCPSCGGIIAIPGQRAAGAVVASPAKSHCTDCWAEIMAVPDMPFQCPKCGAKWPKWYPPSHWVSFLGMRDGRDETACAYVKGFLEEPEELQIHLLQLNTMLWTWEAAYRGGTTHVMAESEAKVKLTRERIERDWGGGMWHRACMAMPPHLRHVMSPDFDTAGDYHGTTPAAPPAPFRYARFEGREPANRKAGLLKAFEDLGFGSRGFDLLMWRLANAVKAGEGEETVLDYLHCKILESAVPRELLVALVQDAADELRSSAEYMKPEFADQRTWWCLDFAVPWRDGDEARHTALRAGASYIEDYTRSYQDQEDGVLSFHALYSREEEVRAGAAAVQECGASRVHVIPFGRRDDCIRLSPGMASFLAQADP